MLVSCVSTFSHDRAELAESDTNRKRSTLHATNVLLVFEHDEDDQDRNR